MDSSIFTKDSARRNVGNHLPARKTRSLTKQRNLEIAEDLKEEEPVENVTFSPSIYFKKAFTLFDYDKDGVISIHDLKIVMKSLGHKVSEKELTEMIKGIDKNGNGKIELNEFLDMMAAKQKTMEALEGEIKQAFQFFDMDGDGFISMSELKEVAVKLGEDLSEEEIDEMIREADRNGDGQVDFDEFLKMMMYEADMMPVKSQR